jgi:hypothetical protein
MRLKSILAIATAAAVVGAGVAIASHAPEIDPATVPTGFFVAHNYVADVPVSAIARAVEPNGTDVFVQHLSLGANQVFAWHTHPGPVVVTVRTGSLTYRDAGPNACRDRTYTAGEGFVDPRLRPRAPRHRGAGGGGNLFDFLPASWFGEPPNHGTGTGGVLVANYRRGSRPSGRKSSPVSCHRLRQIPS